MEVERAKALYLFIITSCRSKSTNKYPKKKEFIVGEESDTDMETVVVMKNTTPKKSNQSALRQTCCGST